MTLKPGEETVNVLFGAYGLQVSGNLIADRNTFAAFVGLNV